MKEYWKKLTRTHRCFLVIGLTVGLPVVVCIVLVAGLVEAGKFVVKVQI